MLWQKDVNTGQGEYSAVFNFFSILLVSIITFSFIYGYMKFKGIKLSFTGLNRFQAKYIGHALLGFGAYFFIYIIGLTLVSAFVPGFDSSQEQDLGVATSQAGLNLLLVFISLVIFPPLIEEFVMRGFLFGGLRQYMSFWETTFIVSILFAVAHLPGGKEGLLWVGALDTLILSYVLCYLREKSSSLWPAIGLHALKNGVAFTLVFVFPDIIG